MSTSLSGVCAAVYAGFGVSVIVDSTIPPELKRAPASLSLPALADTELAAFFGREAPASLRAPLPEVIRGAFQGHY